MKNLKLAAVSSALALLAPLAFATNGDTYYPERGNPGHTGGHKPHTDKPAVVVDNRPTVVNAPVIKGGDVNGVVKGTVNGQVEGTVNGTVNGTNKNNNKNVVTVNPEIGVNLNPQIDLKAEGGKGGQAASEATAINEGNKLENTNIFEAAEPVKPMGNVGAVTIIPAANCGQGWAMNVSLPGFGAGGGNSDISKFCLSNDAAKAAIQAGLVAKDTGIVAAGLAGLRKLHTEFDQASKVVIENLKKPCAGKAAGISILMLTEENMECDGGYLKGTREWIESMEKADAERARAAAEAARVQQAEAAASASASATAAAAEAGRQAALREIERDAQARKEAAAAAAKLKEEQRKAAAAKAKEVPCVKALKPARPEQEVCVAPEVAKRNNWTLVQPK